MNFIDIHGHYAWQIDDGIQSVEECKQALEIAKKNNIQTIIATPHLVGEVHYIEELKEIKDRIIELKNLGNQYDIEVLFGSEIMLNSDYMKLIQSQCLISFENTDYLLCEFDVRKELGNEDEVEDRLYELQVAGYKPIIAHVERYFHKKIDIERVENFIDMGYVIQVNTSSLMGEHGKMCKNNAWKLIEKGLCHVVATDTHRVKGTRQPNMLEAYQEIKKHYGEANANLLCIDNPRHIISNEDIEKMTVKQSCFKRFLGGI